MADQVLDCKGMNCPMPIVAITKAVKSITSGQTLEVHATDLAFKMDIEAWSRRTGNPILSFTEGDVLCAVIAIQ